ncbi:MAG: NADPH-dependent F420 reductase [Aeromicrobium sp.]
MTDEQIIPDVTSLTVGVLGGTGAQGAGLALRWASAGIEVLIGSRDAERAAEAATRIRGLVPHSRVSGVANAECAERSDIVVIAVPWDAHEKTLIGVADHLVGKILVDCVNPLGFDKQGPFVLDVAEGSAAQQAAALLPETRVTGAFHNVSAVLLDDAALSPVDTDVLVLGEKKADTDLVQALAETIEGVRGVYGGRLRNSAQVEALTANLIAMNRRYKGHAGIRITGGP